MHDALFTASVVLATRTLEHDKVLHYIAGAAIGKFAGSLCDKLYTGGPNRFSKRQMNALCSAGAAALVGAIKELYDHKYGGNVEFNDFAVTAAGGLFISFKY